MDPGNRKPLPGTRGGRVGIAHCHWASKLDNELVYLCTSMSSRAWPYQGTATYKTDQPASAT